MPLSIWPWTDWKSLDGPACCWNIEFRFARPLRALEIPWLIGRISRSARVPEVPACTLGETAFCAGDAVVVPGVTAVPPGVKPESDEIVPLEPLGPAPRGTGAAPAVPFSSACLFCSKVGISMSVSEKNYFYIELARRGTVELYLHAYNGLVNNAPRQPGIVIDSSGQHKRMPRPSSKSL